MLGLSQKENFTETLDTISGTEELLTGELLGGRFRT